MMTSNWNIFRVTGHLCGEFTDHRWIPRRNISALLVICAGNSPITGGFPAKGPVKRIYDAFFDMRLNKRLSKEKWGWWFETPSHPLWRHCNDMVRMFFRQYETFCIQHCCEWTVAVSHVCHTVLKTDAKIILNIWINSVTRGLVNYAGIMRS